MNPDLVPAPTLPAQGDSMSLEDKEELALKLLASLPRSRLAIVQQQITPLLQLDILGNLPTEVALQILTYVPYQTLLTCSLVNKHWQRLANDPSLWKRLCDARKWAWRQPPPRFPPFSTRPRGEWDPSDDDEGIGDSDEDYELDGGFVGSVEEAKAELTMMHAQLGSSSVVNPYPKVLHRRAKTKSARRSAPPILKDVIPEIPPFRRKPDYKLLHQTHIRLKNRFLTPSYRLSPLQTKHSLNTGGHTGTIYCLQLYTYPETGRQVLFTGSRDRTIREWNLTTRVVERVLGGVHASSVLSVWAYGGHIASAGSDRQVVLWELRTGRVVKVLADHEDSVLCVRFNDEFLASCSKDRTIRVYSFPDLEPMWVLDAHRAAVNTISLSGSYIVTGSGDRSIRLWDVKTGKLLRTFDNHHTRGIAAIDFRPPLVLSGSSDKHIRLFDVTTLQGWSTYPEENTTAPTQAGLVPLPFPPASPPPGPASCPTCGSDSARGQGGVGAGEIRRTGSLGRNNNVTASSASSNTPSSSHPPTFEDDMPMPQTHDGLVRSVVMTDDLVVSASYDFTIKIWDRTTGEMKVNLTGGHTGRIFCVGVDGTKVVSCGEDQTICVWDFGHGIDTSFVQL